MDDCGDIQLLAVVSRTGRDERASHAGLSVGDVNKDPDKYVPQNNLTLEFGPDVPFPALEFGKTYRITITAE